jgi:hypothetical protein
MLDCGRIGQQRDNEDEPPQHVLVGSTEQDCEIPNRTHVGLDDATLAIDADLLDLQLGQRLSLVAPLGDQLGPDLALLVGERHRKIPCGPWLSPSRPRRQSGRSGDAEPVYGSAPDIAGKGLANPIAMLVSFAMALRYSFAMGREADLVDQAIAAALAGGLRARPGFFQCC